MKKRILALLVCFVLVLSVIVSGCSKRGEETAKTSNPSSDKGTTDDAKADGSKEESNSPWKLLSESSVNTKVNYAGFLNESIGVTVGYSGETSYTSDGGKKWSKSGNVSACRYGLNLYDESLFISIGNAGVNLSSDDKGRTWYHLGEFPLKNGNFNKFLTIIDPQNMYIGATKSLGVSKDGGQTWTDIPVPDEIQRMVGMFFLTTDIGYLLNMDGTLYKTVDACKTWTTQKIDLAGERIASSTMPSVTMNFKDEQHGMIIFATKSFKHIC